VIHTTKGIEKVLNIFIEKTPLVTSTCVKNALKKEERLSVLTIFDKHKKTICVRSPINKHLMVIEGLETCVCTGTG
jgi:hypothetical protein